VAFAAAALTLYSSRTGAGGARYEPLVRVGLENAVVGDPGDAPRGSGASS
jgi:hypothetical protein